MNLTPLFRIVLCLFEDCHAGTHKSCKMGTSVERGELLFCNCKCHKAKKENHGRK